MIALIKGSLLGALLTLVVAMFLGAAGTSGGMLAVFDFVVEGTRLYWSWALFCIGASLAWAMIALIGD